MDEDEYIKNIGIIIQEKRKELGVKQVDLAHSIGIEDSALRRIESGRTNPTIKTLLKISTALGIQVEDLLIRKR